MLFYFLCNHIGLPWLYLNPNGFKQLIEINKDSVTLLASYSVIVVFAYVLTGKIFRGQALSIRSIRLEMLRNEKINLFPILLVALIALPISIAKILDSSPLLALLSGDALIANAMRVSQETSGNTLFAGIKDSYINIIFNVLNYTLVILLLAAIVKKRKRLYALYLLLLIILGMYSFANVSKGFIIGPLLSMVLIYSLVYGGGILVIKKQLLNIIIATGLVAVFSSWVMGNDSVEIFYPIERLVFGNLLPQYVVANYFNFDNLLYGTTVPSWYSFGFHTQFDLNIWTWKQLMGWSEGKDFYTAPSSFVAEAHANYHFYGVIISTCLLFTLYRIVDSLIIKIRSETVYISMLVFSRLHLSYISVSPASGRLVDYYYWAILLFGLYFYRLSFFKPRP
jgi:hypothetical protein